MVALAFIDFLVSGYGREERVTAWVDDFEIWVIPILNPENYKSIVDHDLVSPWWRKNFRDKDFNGVSDLQSDGVDLKRNMKSGTLAWNQKS